MNTLSVSNLSKKFGTQKVIDDLSFSVPEHSIFGFIGQNGAGKTTTMKMVLGLIKPDSGNIHVCGEKVSYGQTKTNRHIGYLPDVPEFYGYMRPLEYLRLCGEITGLTAREIKSKSHELLGLVGLDNSNKKIGGFSRGMKQRLGIAQALLGEPKLLICDEPTSSLDPIGRKEILDILSQVKGKTTVIFSTHILSDVERICDRIAVLNNGKLALSGTLTEIKAQHKMDSLAVEFASAEDMQRFNNSAIITGILKSVERTTTGMLIHSSNIHATQSTVISVLDIEKILPLRLELLEPTLESLFMEAIK